MVSGVGCGISGVSKGNGGVSCFWSTGGCSARAVDIRCVRYVNCAGGAD